MMDSCGFRGCLRLGKETTTIRNNEDEHILVFCKEHQTIFKQMLRVLAEQAYSQGLEDFKTKVVDRVKEQHAKGEDEEEQESPVPTRIQGEIVRPGHDAWPG